MKHLVFIFFAATFVSPACLLPESETKPPKPKLKEPDIVTPGDWNGSPPSDATVLFDGKDVSGWTKEDGRPAPWKVEGGAMIAGGGSIISKHLFSDAQFHIEFDLPDNKDGNSGVYIHRLFEVQIMNSSKEKTSGSPDQQCGALYKKFTPLVNVTRKPGEWQTYDIVFHGVKLEDGKLKTPARVTVMHNGVLVQYNRALARGTGAGGKRPLVEKGPIMLQDHGNPVRYRNIWIREIPPLNEFTGRPHDLTDKKEFAAKMKAGTVSTNETAGARPEDATFIFDGKDTSGLAGKNNEFKWSVKDGYMEVVRGSGGIRSKARFEDVQLHVEWATPSEVKGNGQGRGNSGVFLGRSEVQVLDSYNNKTYPDGQASALYKQYPPMFNACRPPGIWQSYDIIYFAPDYDEEGKLANPGTFTVFHNGVIVHDHVINKRAGKRGPKAGNPVLGNLSLQDHGNPVRYRNIWYRVLKPVL